MSECCICHEKKNLYILEHQFDDAELPFRFEVCGRCWNVIAAIAVKAVSKGLRKIAINTETVGER